MNVQLETIIKEELTMRFQQDAPTTHDELFKKFIFDRETVNETVLRQVVSHMDLSLFVNVHYIYLLTEKDITDKTYDLEMSDTMGLLYERKKAIHTLYTGDLIINLNKHIVSDVTWENNDQEVLISIFHEARHAWQSQENNPFYPHTVESLRMVFRLEPNPSISLEEMEQDAEIYGRNETARILEEMDDLFSEDPLVDWDRVKDERNDEDDDIYEDDDY